MADLQELRLKARVMLHLADPVDALYWALKFIGGCNIDLVQLPATIAHTNYVPFWRICLRVTGKHILNQSLWWHLDKGRRCNIACRIKPLFQLGFCRGRV